MFRNLCLQYSKTLLRQQRSQQQYSLASGKNGRMQSFNQLVKKVVTRPQISQPSQKMTVQPARFFHSSRVHFNRYKVEATTSKGPISWTGLAILLATGGGLVWYFKNEKKKVEEAKATKVNQSAGRPSIGGPFKLTDHTGKLRSSEEFKGQWIMLYFGFTFCPDICPEELEKLTEMLEILDTNEETKELVQPIFITIDPHRDTPEKMAEYIKDFHPRLIGLTGTEEEIRDVAKAYRIYFSKPIGDDEDYLVDHSIIMYLMDPNGDFCAYYGQNSTADQAAANIAHRISEFNRNR